MILFGRSKVPANISQLLDICQKEINAGKYQKAARTAHSFIVQYRDNRSFSNQENMRRQGYGYFMLCQAIIKQLETCSHAQRYEILLAFFASNAMARRAFQVSMGGRVGEGLDDLKDHEDYYFAKAVRAMYDKIYQAYDRTETEHADLAAHEQLKSTGF